MRERTDELAWLPMVPGDVLAIDTINGELAAVELGTPERSVAWLEKTQSTLVELIRLGARLDHLAAEVEGMQTIILGNEAERLERRAEQLRREIESTKTKHASTVVLPRLELFDRERIIKRFFYGGSEDDN